MEVEWIEGTADIVEFLGGEVAGAVGLVNTTGHGRPCWPARTLLCRVVLVAGLRGRGGVWAVDVFAEFVRDLVGFTGLVRAGVADGDGVEPCRRWRVHAGVTLRIDRP